MAVSFGRVDVGWRARLRAIVAAQGVDPTGTLVGGMAAIVMVGLLGIAHVAGAPYSWIVDLDSERNVPAAFSGLLLLTAAALAVELRHHARLRPVMGLAGLFAFMAFDEVFTIHEHLEHWTGVHWELLYAPVTALAAVALAVAWPRLADTEWSRPALAGGAACWAFAQLLEFAAWEGTTPVPSYDVMMVTEELSEMTGSLLFIVALLCIRRAWLVSPRSA